MMANILRSIPMLLVIGFNLLLAILFSFDCREASETDSFIIITFTGMLSISTYIISSTLFRTLQLRKKENKRCSFPDEEVN